MTPTPAAPCKNYVSKCITDDCISADEIENCDRFDCDAYCKLTEAREATIRNQTLDAVLTRVQNEEMFLTMAADNSEIYYLTGNHIRKIIESLRTQEAQQHRGDPR